LEPVSQATAIKLGRLKTLLQGAPLRESEARSIRRLLDAPRARQKLDAGAPSRTENAAGLIAAARQDRLPLKRLARVAGISYTQCLRFERREAHATDAEVKALRAAVRTLKADPTNTTDKGAK
jgi:hypothetical protein